MNNKNENFPSANNHNEITGIDYPLFSETILKNDKEIFDVKVFCKYYVGFLVEQRKQYLLSLNIIMPIIPYFSLLFNIVIKVITSKTCADKETVSVLSMIETDNILNQIILIIQSVGKVNTNSSTAILKFSAMRIGVRYG